MQSWKVHVNESAQQKQFSYLFLLSYFSLFIKNRVKYIREKSNLRINKANQGKQV